MSNYALCIDGPFTKKLFMLSPRVTKHVKMIIPSVSQADYFTDIDKMPESASVQTVIYSKIPYAEFVYPNSGILVSLMSICERTTLQDAIRIMSKDFVINDIVAKYERV